MPMSGRLSSLPSKKMMCSSWLWKFKSSFRILFKMHTNSLLGFDVFCHDRITSVSIVVNHTSGTMKARSVFWYDPTDFKDSTRSSWDALLARWALLQVCWRVSIKKRIRRQLLWMKCYVSWALLVLHFCDLHWEVQSVLREVEMVGDVQVRFKQPQTTVSFRTSSAFSCFGASAPLP